MSDREEMSRDEIISIENSVISYLGNARLHFENKDYQRALSFLELVENEIEYLAKYNAAQQGRAVDGAIAQTGQVAGATRPATNANRSAARRESR